MGAENAISVIWEAIDTSDWYRIDEDYKIGLAEYCPSLRLVHLIAAYTGANGILNVQTHIIPPEKYKPVNDWNGVVFHTYDPSQTSTVVTAILQKGYNGGFKIAYGVNQKAYRIFIDVYYRV